MSNFNWCHGPSCHKRQTTTRVRGSKGNKVLRTVKIALDYGYRNSVWKYFCDQTCMHEFIYKHIEEFIRLHPRTESLETPIDVVVEDKTDWHGQPYATKVIKEVVDNA
tara:strand:+ start:296 stop:619 length:324 start_codon:yes stop_codon:yes gene_type:complete